MLVLCIFKIYCKLSDDDMEFEMVFVERDIWECYKIIKMLMGIWLYGIVIMFFFLVGWGLFNFELGDIVCVLNWCEDNFVGCIYLVFLVIFVFVIFLVVFVVFFVKMYQRLLYELDVNVIVLRDFKKVKKVVIIILVGVIIFVVGWMLYYVCVMMFVFGGLEMFDFVILFIFGIFVKVSVVFNFFICLFVSKW